jgi:1-acyl-sn-glycerol-3-phosphate acyltransferase
MNYTETEGIHNQPYVPIQANVLQALLRGVRVASHLLYALLIAVVYPMLTLQARQFIMRRWSRALLRILQVRLETGGHLPPQRKRGSLLVANHTSWLDVYALSAIQPSSFVAKAEVRSWPLIGLLCRRAQTIFIERNLRRDTMRTNILIAGRLNQGECVALFPEGTTTDGTQVRHFHSSLLQCAVDTECDVYPVTIRYHDGSGRSCKDAAFIGDMTFLQSLVKILFSGSLHVTLVFLPAISGAQKTRRALADQAHASIRATLHDLARCYGNTPHTALQQRLRRMVYGNAMADAAMRSASQHPTSPFQSAYFMLLSPAFKFKKHSSGF